MNRKDTNTRHSSTWVLLALLVAASFAVRVAAWGYWRTGAIESEGAEYARIAENLRNGVGYQGIVSPGPQLVFPPLFPVLIAGASLVTHDYELAGRLVALVLGALLPLPVFGIASRLFNRNAGFIAAALTLLHPVLVNLSFSVLSEGPYTTLFLAAVYVVVRALGHPSIKWWLLVGGAFGLAYLTRQEAMAAVLIAMVFALTATEGSAALRCKRAAAALGVFLLLALPEVILIYRATGKIRLEGKSTQFFALGQRMLAADANPGLDHATHDVQADEPSPAPNAPSWQSWEEKWAFYAVDSHLNVTGAAMRSHSDVVRETRIPPGALLHLVEKGVRQNAPRLVSRLSERWFGAPFLPALALLGVFRRPWRRPQAVSRMFVMLIAAAPVVATFSALWTQDRYYFVLIPFFCIWAGNGLLELGLWTKATLAAVGWTIPSLPAVSEYVIPGLIGLAMVIYPIPAVRDPQFIFAFSSPSTRVEKEVGLSVGQQQHPVRIMDLSIPLAFYAEAQWVMFPYCDAESALRFLDKQRVDYVVLRRGVVFTKYYGDWLNEGIPDSRAELLHLSPDAAARFVIYRWHSTARAGAGGQLGS